MKECDNSTRKIHISSNFILSISLLIMFDTLLLRPSLHCNTPPHFTQLHFTTLRSTTLHYTSPNYTSLHFTTLHPATLHYTSLHLSTLHFLSFTLCYRYQLHTKQVVHCDVTMRRARAIIVAVQRQQLLHILRVCL
jgi:hypothetical protein